MMHTERIRDVIRYLKRFKNATVVIRIDDGVLDSPLFASHIHDIALLHETGIKVVIVPGAAGHISSVLDAYSISWSFKNGIRITGDEGMDFIKMAAFDASNRIMTRFTAERCTAVIGNWVRSRGRGVVDGVDYGSAGLVEKVQTDALRRAIEDGFIPILPCVGWTATGRPYNLSSTELAVATATALSADKLFFLACGASISIDDYAMPETAALSPEGRMAAISVDEVPQFLELNPGTSPDGRDSAGLAELLHQGRKACLGGVSRTHILDADIDGVIPAEIFSDLGSGTMIYRSDYGSFRTMTRDDIPSVLSLMNPFIEDGILLPRTPEDLDQQLADFTVYEIDGGIRACAALHLFSQENSTLAEIAGLAVDESYAHMGIGPRLMQLIMDKARQAGCAGVFVLTTQTADWFERFGFIPCEINKLPQQRMEKWDKKRGSRMLICEFH